MARKERGIELETEVQIVGEEAMSAICRRKIAVLMGGPGSERDVSMATGKGRREGLAIVRR